MHQFILAPLLFLFINCIELSMQAKNPLSGKPFYIHPPFQDLMDQAIRSLTPGTRDLNVIETNLKLARNAPVAIWLDFMAKVQPDTTSLDTMNGVLLDASKQPIPGLVVFVLYNLPNRDCGAGGSSGEICCGGLLPDGRCDYKETSDCSLGLSTYKSFYIDKIVNLVNKYKEAVPMAFVIEPNSFPNIVTNAKLPSCAIASQTSIIQGLTYAVDELNNADPNIPLYLDTAHGGWLAYKENFKRTVELLTNFNFVKKVKGFAINVSNYQPLGTLCPEANFCLPERDNSGHRCCSDPCNINIKGNPANSELNYAQLLQASFPGKSFIIDTARNGVSRSRKNCSNWCNIKKAGLGMLPTANTQIPFVDAFLWVKPPGTTDGCTEDLPDGGGKCLAFTKDCASEDSIGIVPDDPRLPPAGNFSTALMANMARNANFFTASSAFVISSSIVDQFVFPVLFIGILALCI